MEQDRLIPLAEGVNRYRQSGGPSNSYDWYRKSALGEGTVWMGSRVPVVKVRGRWLIKECDVLDAIDASKREADDRREATLDYDNHILHGAVQDSIQTTWGYDQREADFHFHFDRVTSYQGRSNGSWICSACWIPASLEHDKPECHTCADWGGCGRDCTLSAVVCSRCRTRMQR